MHTDYCITFHDLKLVVEYEKNHKSTMEKRLLKYFFALNSFQPANPHHTMHLVRSALQNKQHLLLQMPIPHQEIDFLCVKGGHMQYTLINSAKPKINTNAFLCRAFSYYMNLHTREPLSDARPFYSSQTYSQPDNLEDASCANMLLLPVAPFCDMFYQFQQEQQKEDSTLTILVKLMNYFEAPYLSVLIRCYSLNLLDSGDLLEELLQVDSARVSAEFHRLWLDESLLAPTMQDDFNRFEQLVKSTGELYLQEEYISTRTLNKALSNMKAIYGAVRGE